MGSIPITRSILAAHIAQAVEHFLGKEEVAGSSPVVGTIKGEPLEGKTSYIRPVAQLAEQRSPKPQVGGSSPSWPAIIGRH